MKKLFFIGGVLCQFAQAQLPTDSLLADSLLTEEMDVAHVFAPLDKSAIHSGVLIDQYLYRIEGLPFSGNVSGIESIDAI